MYSSVYVSTCEKVNRINKIKKNKVIGCIRVRVVRSRVRVMVRNADGGIGIRSTCLREEDYKC